MDDVKQREELKRERAWDPKECWLAIQDMIAFVEPNQPPHKRHNRPRWHKEN
ncbi:MAG: hypothetical protein ACI8QI_001168 [Limisphaerales bacterium]|jgi:hypothetical protein